MADFARAYHAIREKEGRMYSDEVLRTLPDISTESPLHAEWMIRKASLERLMGHLHSLDRPLRILDLGCGNGWMSHHLSHLPGAEVLGMDLVTEELAQASRVFADRTNLQFIEGNVFEEIQGQFDVVTMGASVQYFPDLSVLVTRLRELLNANGEIHIFDSPFYREKERAKAAARSLAYYSSMGFPELAECYFQPSLQEMQNLEGELRYDPNTWQKRLLRKFRKDLDSPFPWWMLRV